MMSPRRIRERKAMLKAWGLAQPDIATRMAAKRISRTPVMGKAARLVLAAWKAANARSIIIEHDWAWNGRLGKRNGKAAGIVCHHAAASVASPEDVHRWHLARGFLGIGYHYYVRKDGSIHRGRPEWAMGAHTLGHNDMLGICAEGNFETETMPAAQLEALIWLVADVADRNKIKSKRRYRHSKLNPTACPGRNYPWAQVRG